MDKPKSSTRMNWGKAGIQQKWDMIETNVISHSFNLHTHLIQAYTLTN
jgi:hypothetical protein